MKQHEWSDSYFCVRCGISRETAVDKRRLCGSVPKTKKVAWRERKRIRRASGQPIEIVGHKTVTGRSKYLPHENTREINRRAQRFP